MAVAEGLITPDQLRRITEEKEKVQEALDKKRKADDEHQQLTTPSCRSRSTPTCSSASPRWSAEPPLRREREVLAVRLSSQYRTDGGRASRPAGDIT